jgi:hypothetical protein
MVEAAAQTRAAGFLFSELMICIIWKDNFVPFTVDGFNFDKFK